jgi:hypothetical protein
MCTAPPCPLRPGSPLRPCPCVAGWGHLPRRRHHRSLCQPLEVDLWRVLLSVCFFIPVATVVDGVGVTLMLLPRVPFAMLRGMHLVGDTARVCEDVRVGVPV